jgi:hypothetical protein
MQVSNIYLPLAQTDLESVTLCTLHYLNFVLDGAQRVRVSFSHVSRMVPAPRKRVRVIEISNTLCEKAGGCMRKHR